MAELRTLGYAWRDRGAAFTEHEALAQAVEQVIQQVRGLPPGSVVHETAHIDYLGTVELEDPTQPDQQYLLTTSYSVPVD